MKTKLKSIGEGVIGFGDIKEWDMVSEAPFISSITDSNGGARFTLINANSPLCSNIVSPDIHNPSSWFIVISSFDKGFVVNARAPLIIKNGTIAQVIREDASYSFIETLFLESASRGVRKSVGKIHGQKNLATLYIRGTLPLEELKSFDFSKSAQAIFHGNVLPYDLEELDTPSYAEIELNNFGDSSVGLRPFHLNVVVAINYKIPEGLERYLGDYLLKELVANVECFDGKNECYFTTPISTNRE